MKKYKILGITEYAERHLTVDNLETLQEMVGLTVCESEETNGIDEKPLMIMPDTELTHVDFLQLEEV